MNILKDIFDSTLQREGVEIAADGGIKKGFCRRNETGSTDPYMTLYLPHTDQINQGTIFSLNGDKYLVLKAVTSENDTYKKYQCIKTNNSFKIMYGKNDLVLYDCYMKELADSLNANSDGITVSSKIDFVLPLNDDTKRIAINRRFFCGYYGLAWKVSDVNYKGNLCYLGCERDAVLNTDDTINGIADRWSYDSETDTYTVKITQDTINLLKDETETINVSVSKNGTVLSPQPVIEWTIENGSICSVDNNIITALSVGETTVTGSYKAKEDDICKTDSVKVIVTEETPMPDYDTYTVIAEPTTVSIENTKTANVAVKVLRNGTEIENPTVISSVSDKAVCAYNNGVITALGVGTATITLEYRGGDVLSDKYNSAIINVTVTEYVAPTETYIKVTPVYNADGYYNQNDGNSTKYTASLVNGTGITKKWDITCSSAELTEDVDYSFMIGSKPQYFYVSNLQGNKSGFVTVHVEEKTTKCTLDYVIKLNG